LQATASALKELTVPLIGSTLTPIVVFLPLITITGVTGSFFRALAIAMSVALLTSLVLALVWTSNLSTRLIRRHQHGVHEEEPTTGLFARIIAFYERASRQALHRPFALGALGLMLIAASYLSYRSLGSDMLPAFDEGGFILDYVMPPGTSLQETDRVLRSVDTILRATPEVEITSREDGAGAGFAAVTEPNTGDFTVKLKPNAAAIRKKSSANCASKLSSSQPGLDIEFVSKLQDMIGDLTGAPEPVVVKLFSQDPDLLASWAPQVADALAKVKIGGKMAVVDIADGIEKTTSGPAVRFTVNTQAVDRAGFTPEELGTVTVALVEGEPAVAPILMNSRTYPVRVRFPAATRGSPEAMSGTMLVNSNGSTATLGSLTAIDELPGQLEIRRENLQLLVEVTARLEGVDLGTGVAAVQKAVADLKLPPSIRVEYGGTYREQQKSFRDLTIVLLLAIVLVFLVLLFEFRSFTAPVAILSSAVLSTSGVLFSLLITRTTLNVSSFMGLIMVVGIVAKNGILLLDANQKCGPRACRWRKRSSTLAAGGCGRS
jgi:multidrug efflux pump subunit AcrB